MTGEPRLGHLVGRPLPKFRVQGSFGDTLTQENLLGAPSLIVFFPFAFTPICDGELVKLEQSIRQFDDVGILAISCDAPATLRTFGEMRDFSFELGSDFWPHGAAAKAFGVFNEDSGHPLRASFVTNAAGIITWSVINPSGQGRDPGDYQQAIAVQ